MKVIIISLILLCTGCTQTSIGLNNELMKKFEVNGSYSNHCAGVNVPMCKTYVYGVHKDRRREHTLQGVKFLGETIVKSLLGG